VSSSVPDFGYTQAESNDGTVMTTANTNALATVDRANTGLVNIVNLNLTSIVNLVNNNLVPGLIRNNHVPASDHLAVSNSMLNNTPPHASTSTTIFQKQQTKQIKPLSIMPLISESVAFLCNLAKLETTGRTAFTTSI
jgi:hypothetical protein